MSSCSRVTRCTPRIPCLMLLVTLTAAGVQAQDRLFIGTGEIGAFGRFGERIGTAPGAVYGKLVAGGRYIATASGAFDTSTGAFTPAAGGVVIAVDPRRPRLFMHDLAVVSVFDLERHVSTPLFESTGLATLLPAPARAQLASDANELFVWHRAAGNGEEVAVVDLASGSVSRRFPIGTVLGSFSDWRVAADGRRLFVVDGAEIRLLDGATGLPLAPPVSGSGKIVDDRVNRRIYVLDAVGRLRAFDDALRPLGQLAVRASCGVVPAVFSSHSGRLYIVESDSQGSQKEGVTYTYFLGVFDAATGRRLDSRDVTSAAGLPMGPNFCGPGPLAVITAPGAPQGLAATVSGRDVTLTFTNVGDASGFVLDVGFSPGRTDLSTFVGGATTATFTNVPSGTYYLRVRGGNAFGGGRPSNEVVVTVP
jgi:hypothetical protein